MPQIIPHPAAAHPIRSIYSCRHLIDRLSSCAGIGTARDATEPRDGLAEEGFRRRGPRRDTQPRDAPEVKRVHFVQRPGAERPAPRHFAKPPRVRRIGAAENEQRIPVERLDRILPDLRRAADLGHGLDPETRPERADDRFHVVRVHRRLRHDANRAAGIRQVTDLLSRRDREPPSTYRLDFADYPPDFRVRGLAHDDHRKPALRERARRDVDALDERTRRVHDLEMPRRGRRAHGRRNAVRRKENRPAFRHFRDVLDENEPATREPFHHELVVDELVKAMQPAAGRARRQALGLAQRASNAGAKTVRIENFDFHAAYYTKTAATGETDFLTPCGGGEGGGGGGGEHLTIALPFYGIISPTMSEQENTKERTRKPSRPGRRLLVASLALAWLAFAPSYLGEFAAERFLLAKLNDPKAGLSCERVEVAFSYRELVLHRRVRHLAIRGLAVDLGPQLEAVTNSLFDTKSAAFDVTLDATNGRDASAMRGTVRGSVLDWPFSADFKVTSTRRDFATFSGSAEFALAAEPSAEAYGHGTAKFEASPKRWSATSELDETAFRSDDDVFGRVFRRLPLDGIAGPSVSGSLSASVRAERAPGRSYATWSVSTPLRVDAAACTVGENAIALDSLSLRLAASGLDDHVDLAPLRLHAKRIEAAGYALEGLYATLLETDRGFLVSEAGAGFCGGAVRLYSLSLDPERLNAGFTLFLDDIDAGEMLNHLPGFHGEASGRLHGKLPLAIRDGATVRLRDAFLYSTPGETGKLRLDDTSAIDANLAAAGVPDATRANLSRALADLDYSVLKLRLMRESADRSALELKLEGSASASGKSVPVSLDVTFHGELEQLLNFGLKAATRK